MPHILKSAVFLIFPGVQNRYMQRVSLCILRRIYPDVVLRGGANSVSVLLSLSDPRGTTWKLTGSSWLEGSSGKFPRAEAVSCTNVWGWQTIFATNFRLEWYSSVAFHWCSSSQASWLSFAASKNFFLRSQADGIFRVRIAYFSKSIFRTPGHSWQLCELPLPSNVQPLPSDAIFQSQEVDEVHGSLGRTSVLQTLHQPIWPKSQVKIWRRHLMWLQFSCIWMSSPSCW